MPEITTVKPLDPFEKHVFKVPEQVPLEPIVLSKELLEQGKIPDTMLELSFYEEARRKYIVIKDSVPFIYLLLKGKIMKDWKTTLAGGLGLLATLVGYFGFDIPTEVQLAIVSITVFIVGFFSKDAPTEGK